MESRQPSGKRSELLRRADDDSIKDLHQLLCHGEYVDLDVLCGQHALQRACTLGLETTVLFLLDCGAEVNGVDAEHHTPLHCSVLSNSLQCLSYLLACEDLDIDVQDAEGNTALLLASAMTAVKAVEILGKYHCDTNVKNKQGKTALHSALSSTFCPSSSLQRPENKEMIFRRYNCFRAIANAGAYITVTDDINQMSPLHLAVKENNYPAVVFLISKNCPLNTEAKLESPITFRGRHTFEEYSNVVPLTLALYYRNFDLTLLLLKSGCNYYYLYSYPVILEHSARIWHFFSEYLKEPRSLKESCVNVIRGRIGCDLEANVERMGLPGFLIQMVLPMPSNESYTETDIFHIMTTLYPPCT